MTTHDSRSVSSRQGRGTHDRGRDVRPFDGPLALAMSREAERAYDTMRVVTGSNLSRLAGLPGVPSRTRISHLRTDDPGPIHQLDALIRAKIAVGDPIDECGRIPIHFWETIEMALDTNRVPLATAIVSDQHHDSAQDIAAFEAIQSGLGDAALDRLIAAEQAELASKRTLLTCLLLERKKRRGTA